MRKTLLVTLLLGVAQLTVAKTECNGIALGEDGVICATINGGGMAQLNTRDRTLLFGHDGKLLTAPTHIIGDFNDGLAAAREPAVDGRWGFLNQQGQWQLPPIWHAVKSFAQGHALVQVAEGGPWQVIDRNSQILATLPAGSKAESPFGGGLAMISSPAPQTLWSPDKTITLPAGVNAVTTLREGVLAAKQTDINKVGFLQPDGQWLIAPIYDYARPFMSGFAAVQQNGQWQLIDRKGQLVRLLPGKDVNGHYSSRLWDIRHADDSHSVLRADGSSPYPAGIDLPQILASLPAEIKTQYTIKNVDPLTPGLPLALLIQKEKSDLPAGLILANGQLHWPKGAIGFDEYADLQKEMPFVLETKSGWGAIDAQGAWVIAPRFKELSSFEQGFATITQHETEGLIEANGKTWLPSDGSKWRNVNRTGLAVFEKNGIEGVLNIRSGKVLLAAEKQSLSRPQGMLVVRGDEKVQLEGLWHLGEARWVVTPECDDLKSLRVPDYWQCKPPRDSGKKTELVSSKGERIPVDAIQSDNSTGSYEVIAGEKRGLLTYDGQMLWPQVSGNFELLAFDQEQPWLLISDGLRYAWINPQGKEVFSIGAERLYRRTDQPDIAFGEINGAIAEINIRSGKNISLGNGGYQYRYPDMTLHYKGSDQRGSQAVTSVTLSDGSTHNRLGYWIRVASGTLVLYAEVNDDYTTPLWRPGQADIPTPYMTIEAAGANDWLRAWDSKQQKFVFFDKQLKQILPAAYDEATPFDGGLAWVREGSQLKLLNDKGQTVGQVPISCPGGWTIGNAKPVTCPKQ